ncbi:MAG: PLP-dependent aminotransferase family protein [Parvibaculum sp.]|uniref:aminotransferase-like domain-containing protein n=1 Tax=Parvibaculum sp. TaxID=2024848 RepID=UPI0027174A68|nr:PLP-dependent aminotransferase family protein [Parvibaculum sp.]MDO8839412.1 PLP-dependent aminotransferase family protein [Parvibaculum sp.]
MTISFFAPADIAARPGPRYKAIADALSEAVKMGRVTPGTKLPPLRDLAYRLGVTVGTVSRAYALAAQRGEVTGEVGRGTYVRKRNARNDAAGGVGAATFHTVPDETQAAMKAALPAPVGQKEILGVAMRRLLDALPDMPGRSPFNSYPPVGGAPHQRAMAAKWVAHGDFAPDADELMICSGTQQAILTAVLGTTESGDTILTEALTYTAMANQAASVGRRVAPVDIDEEGLVPQSLDRAARETGARTVFVVPTLHNPTSAVMSERRRRDIADIAETRGLAVIEDDIYGKLVDDRPPPIARFYPEGTWYATSLAKTVACGLRVGFLKPPVAHIERARAIQYGFGQTVPPLMADLAAMLIESGDADTLTMRQIAEMRARHTMLHEALPGHDIATRDTAPYAWLALPDAWRAHAFVEAARTRGLALAAGEDFMVGRTDRASRHVRLALGQPLTRQELAIGLGIIAELLAAGPISSSLVA